MSAAALCSACESPLSAEARFCASCGSPAGTFTEGDRERHLRLARAAPAPLAEKIRKTLLKGERRQVTALFADVVGSTAILETVDPEEWTSLLNTAFDLMSQAVYRYEGTIAHLLGDGLLAFFGTPVAHEDDPERAVRAALEIIDSLKPFSASVRAAQGIDFRVRIGLNTGTVIVGDVGGDLRYQYTAIGDAINVASRIQEKAEPGSILAASDTFRYIAPKFETRYVGSLALKGKAEPVAAYEVLGPRAIPQPSRGLPGLNSPMVGRDAPLSRLEQLVDEAEKDGLGRAAMILGEPGIGKSRLLSELRLRRSVSGNGANFAEGRCLSYGRGLPYHLLLDLLRSLLNLSASTGPQESRAVLEARLEGLAPEQSAQAVLYLTHLLALPLSDAEQAEIEKLTDEVRHDRLLGALGALLGHLGGAGPHILICEDVHWADTSSVDALKALLSPVAALPIVLILSSRPEPDAPIRELADAAVQTFDGRFNEILLTPLSPVDSRGLVASLLEIESLPAEVRGLILDKSEGNPLFLEEVIRMLMEQGAIVRAGDKWVGRDVGHPLKIPDTLQSLLLARIDRLPPDAKRLARIASVVGRQFDHEVLSEVLKVTESAFTVSDALADLESFGLVAPDSPAGKLAFRHALIQEAVYDSILQRDKSPLHLAVAEALERLYPQRESGMAAVLALHFEQAGRPDRSAPYLLEAGEDALRRFAPKEAYELFDRAVRHLEAMPPEHKVLADRVRANLGRRWAGRHFVPGSQQVAELGGAVADAEALGDPRLLAEVHIAISDLLFNLGEKPDLNAALARSIEAAEGLAEELDDDRLRAFPMALRGLGHFSSSNLREAVNLLEKAVPLVERHSTLAEAAFFTGILALSAARLGEFQLADKWAQHEMALAERSGDPNARLDADLHGGMIEAERGDLLKALEMSRRGTELAEEIDNKACALVGYFVMGDQQLRLGLPEKALESLERSTEIAAFCNVEDMENLSRAWLHAVRFELGLGEEVLPALGASLLKARGIKDRLAEGEILRRRALVRARIDDPDWDAVRADFEAAIGIFEDIGARPYIARALKDYGITLHAGRRIGEGQEKLRAALAMFKQLQMIYEEPAEPKPVA